MHLHCLYQCLFRPAAHISGDFSGEVVRCHLSASILEEQRQVHLAKVSSNQRKRALTEQLFVDALGKQPVVERNRVVR